MHNTDTNHNTGLCKMFYLQYAGAPEAAAAEGRDWRAVLLRWEALPSSETHRWEGAANGVKTGFTKSNFY